MTKLNNQIVTKLQKLFYDNKKNPCCNGLGVKVLQIFLGIFGHDFINRPCIAAAVLQTHLSLINLLTHSSFSSQSSKHDNFQNVITNKELKFDRLFAPHHVSRLMCHMSHVPWHMSHVR